MTEPTKSKELEILLSSIEKQYGKGSISVGSRKLDIGVEWIPSGCLGLDRILGGGVPRGRMVEIKGTESGGKTTCSLHFVASVQKMEEKAAFIDAEHALDPEYATNLGVNMEDLLVSQPDNAEQALGITEMLVRSGQYSLVVIDSVASLVPRAEIEGEMGDLHVGLQARLMSQACRKLAPVLGKTNTTLILINQLRSKIGVTYGPSETTPGGNAIKFYSSQRIDVRRIGAVKRGEEIIGNQTRIKVIKNKVARPFLQMDGRIIYGKGLDFSFDLLNIAEAKGLVKRSGAWYSYGDEHKVQGKEAMTSLIRNNPKISEQIRSEILNENPSTDPDPPDPT